MVISLRPPGQTEKEEGSIKGEKTETDWLLLSKDLHFSHEGSTSGADSHKLVVLSHPFHPHHAFIHSRAQEDPARYQKDEPKPQLSALPTMAPCPSQARPVGKQDS